MWLTLFLLGLTSYGIRAIQYDGVGPWFKPTKGELFPRASKDSDEDWFLTIQAASFQFKITGENCDIIEKALTRYNSILLTDAHITSKTASPMPENFVDNLALGELVSLSVNLINPCQRYPSLDMDEEYHLHVDGFRKTATLRAKQVWGILRGLESFSQLIYAWPDGQLSVRVAEITDWPKFRHRGLLLDTSRHFLPVSDILLTLDAMSYNKLNVFHWHIVDDQSFPYESTNFAKFSEKGAFHPTMVYKPSDVQRIIEYARLRGIRVIPEIDTPAHTKSWGLGHPEMLTECYENGFPTGKLGPINPLPDETTWKPLEGLLKEIMDKFPDRYLHLGGDEIPFDCWASNPRIIEYMKEKGYDNDFRNLEAEYFEKLTSLLEGHKVRPIVWQEVYQNVANLPSDTTVQIWTGSWMDLMRNVTSENLFGILSACWYLSDINYGADWEKYYMCDPSDFDGTPEQTARVLGGEACMWGEFVDRTNVHQRTWPRASAVAERLWSIRVQDIDGVARRLEEHTCRMNRRGVPAQPPNGPSYCVL